MTQLGKVNSVDSPRFFGIEVVPSGDALPPDSPTRASLMAYRVTRAFLNRLLVDAGGRPLSPSHAVPAAIGGALGPTGKIGLVRLSVPEHQHHIEGWVLEPRTLQDAGARYASVGSIGVQPVINTLQGTPFAVPFRGRLRLSSGPEPITDLELRTRIEETEVFDDGVPPIDAQQFVEDLHVLAETVLSATTGGKGFPRQTSTLMIAPVGSFLAAIANPGTPL